MLIFTVETQLGKLLGQSDDASDANQIAEMGGQAVKRGRGISLRGWGTVYNTDGNPHFNDSRGGGVLSLFCQYVLICSLQVIWERTDLVYPLVVGGHIFSPDERIRIAQPDAITHHLRIVNATQQDALNYRCRSSSRQRPCVSQSKDNECGPFEQIFRAIFGKVWLTHTWCCLARLVTTK